MAFIDKQLASALIDTIESGEDVQRTTDAFVELLAEKQMLNHAQEIKRWIEQIWKERYGASTITVETASALTSVMKKKIEDLAPGAEVRKIVNPKLIGGARIRIDDRILDGSLLGRLNQIRIHLLDS